MMEFELCSYVSIIMLYIVYIMYSGTTLLRVVVTTMGGMTESHEISMDFVTKRTTSK